MTLVERLRAASISKPHRTDWEDAQLLREAADRIEELERRGCCGVVSEEEPRLNLEVAPDTASVERDEIGQPRSAGGLKNDEGIPM